MVRVVVLLEVVGAIVGETEVGETSVGETVGYEVGELVGPAVVGEMVGPAVGEEVGPGVVGEGVGIAVGELGGVGGWRQFSSPHDPNVYRIHDIAVAVRAYTPG